MSVRKMLLACVLAMVSILPLMGCGDKTTTPAGSGSPAPSSNTTVAE
ncbi:MAG: hypothetical protein ACYC6N_20290 [Pirellulaceae bacterium]